MSDSAVDVSFIIVSWNIADLLKTCLESIFTHSTRSIEVIVVDSASTDHTVTMIRDQFPQVILLAQSENIGFTRGNNIGLNAACGQYLFLLNPDTVLLDDTAAALTKYLDANPTVGIVGPKTLNTDSSYQSTRRRFPTLALELRESLWLAPHLFDLPPSHIPLDNPPPETSHLVDWVQGSALMIRREVYEQIGGMDEGFFMFSEEVDWCKRAADHGWKVAYVGSTSIIHHGGKSTEQTGARSHIYFQTSKIRYFRKHHGASAAAMLRLYILLNYRIQWFIESAKSALGHKREMRQKRRQMYQEVLRSGLRG